MDYLATQEEAILTYYVRKMILACHINASYLIEPNTHSRASSHFFLANDKPTPQNIGAMLTMVQIIKHVMSFMAEAELGVMIINAKEAVYIR